MVFDKELEFIENNNLSTPILFYSSSKIVENLNVIKEAIFSEKVDVYYAMKSCYDSLVLDSLSSRVSGAEVMSELEFCLAEKHHFKSFILNGMGRSYDLLERVALYPNSTIIVDSERDLENISKILETNPEIKNLKLGIRLIFKLDDEEYKCNNYFQLEHKLGHDISSSFCAKFFRFCSSHNRVSWDLLHTHFTINEKMPFIYQKIMQEIKQQLDKYETIYNLSPTRIDVGGGFEIYNPKEKNVFSN